MRVDATHLSCETDACWQFRSDELFDRTNPVATQHIV